MGNKLSCSCAPLIRKAYRYEDSPWQGSRRRDGHLLRLWAEVFHVSASGAGTVKWQQVSEDLVPVNITCIQDQPECVFHITAYNSQVDKILDVRLVQPGTRIGQASECFVYWKDPMTNDTWGLNFTSPIDAKQFRECCVSIRGPRCRGMASAPLTRNASGSAHSSNAPSRAPSRAQSTTHVILNLTRREPRVRRRSPSFKFSRKASSSYSLKLEPPNKQKVKVKRKPVSTPASPSRAREPQCTCMTPEQYARLRAQDPRYRVSSTLPRAQTRSLDDGTKVAAATSSTSLYDNMGAAGGSQVAGQQGTLRAQQAQQAQQAAGAQGAAGGQQAQQAAQQPVPAARATAETATQAHAQAAAGAGPGKVCTATQAGDGFSYTLFIPKTFNTFFCMSAQVEQGSKSEGTQVGESELGSGKGGVQRHHHILQATKSMDYQDSADLVREAELRAAQHNMAYNNNNNNNNNNINNNFQSMRRSAAANKMSKSTDDMRAQEGNLGVDSNTLKRMLKPMTSAESPATSPEMTRRRYNHYNHHNHFNNNTMDPRRQPGRFSASRSSHEIGRGGYPQNRGLYLDLERNGPPVPPGHPGHPGHPGMVSVGVGPGMGGMGHGGGDISPPSDNVLFDNQCYATTPSSSNGNSDMENPPGQQTSHAGQRGQRGAYNNGQNNGGNNSGSPTSRLLLEYEMHLRNTLAKGMDAESYSLHTFEALLSQSMENLEFAESLPLNSRSPYPNRRRPGSAASMNKCSTLPSHLSHRLSVERSVDRPVDRPGSSREGYYSDRNELARERERERERERGYLSDHNSSSRCASCLGESARAQWFRHSDGWRSGSSAYGSGTSSTMTSTLGPPQHHMSLQRGHRRSPWDSLPSLRHDSSLNDSSYKSSRTDSFDQRSLLDRQDSLRSDYLSDRDTRYGIVQQASIESTDSRLCYLTSSEAPEVNPTAVEWDVKVSAYKYKAQRGA
ncbi:Protein still life, isoform SIF type 1 [Frankliniella fusca]|uniref:Protein still life, isoform SIF type 1 n=1 Tax=Frankliniella fusca TaxID=407009 RepID=A0AAE1HSU6_9NEOP|nr:Protein still life, isoform SIF type 1 [Frankliniella fusca]